jgi:small-conductance mechanosensitive channel
MANIKSISEEVFTKIGEEAVNSTPKVLFAILVLVVSAILIRIIMSIIGSRIHSVIDKKRNASIVKTTIKVILWFSVGLMILSILGYEQLATAIGTSSGFIAVGASYAMKDAIQEGIAGLYLMEDEDFVVGNNISVSGVSGEITEIELQRTKIRNNQDETITTISNQKIEPKWTLNNSVQENQSKSNSKN